MRLLFCLLLASWPFVSRAQMYGWREVTPDSLRGTPCSAVALGRSGAGRSTLYAVCRPGLVRSDDGGASWILLRRSVVGLAVPYGNPERIYAGVRDTLLTSSDGGRTWQSMNEAHAGAAGHLSWNRNVNRWETSPFDPDRLALVWSHYGYVDTTVDGGRTFRRLTFPFDSHHGNILNAVASFKEPDRLFVHAYQNQPYADIGSNLLYRTEGWGAAHGPFVAGTPQPSECEACLLADTTGAVYMDHRRSADGGRTWQIMRSGGEIVVVRATSPINAIAYGISATSPFTGYLYHLSSDNGQTWRFIAASPPSFPDAGQRWVKFRLDPTDSTLFVAGDKGLFALRRQTGTAVERAGAAAALHLVAAPNPFRDRLSLTVNGAGGGPIKAELFDPLGRRVAVGDGGPARFSFVTSGLPVGAYVVRVSRGQELATRTVVLVR